MAATVCVTGASGFIASWIVSKLLEKGYLVHGTVRDPDDETKCGHLKALNGASERLKLFKADVLDYESIVAAIRGCDGVFHTACPVAMKFENPDDVLAPALTGTENVLKACYEEKVKRVVMTSSGAAIVADPKRPADKIIDETCWTDDDFCFQNKEWYFVAKTRSEKLAWKMAKDHNLDLVVICPVLVLGPLLQPTLNVSAELVKRLIDGSMEAYPNKYASVVDVRDTAEAHVVAYEKPDASGRYYCLSKVVTYKEMIDALKKHFPQLPFPDMLQEETIGGNPPSKISNKRVRELMTDFVPIEQSLVDTVLSLREKQHLPS